MTGDAAFLSDLMPRPWSPDARHGFRPAGLFVGKGANAIEVAVAQSSGAPTRAALLASWKSRRGGRAAPVLLVLLHPGGAALCGASGEEPPVYPKIDAVQVELNGLFHSNFDGRPTADSRHPSFSFEADI